MLVRTINLPIYNSDIVVIINDWPEANKKFKLKLTDNDMHAEAWSIDDFIEERAEMYLLFKDNCMEYDTIIHEITHATLDICKNCGIKLDVNNQEPITYLSGYIGSEVFKIIDKHKGS